MSVPSENILGVDGRMLFNSGIGTVIRSVLKHMRPRKGIILVRDESSAQWCRENIPSYTPRICDVPIYSIREQFEVAKALQGASVLWIPHFNVPLFARQKLIVTIHDTLHLAHPEMFPGFLKRVYARTLFPAAARKASRIVCVSDFTAKELVRFTGCPREKIQVLHGGVDEEWFTSVPSLPVREKYMVYVGNVKPHKNLMLLLKAFSGVAENLGHHLVIVGKKEGFITEDKEVAAYALKLGERVKFTGWLPESELRSWVAAADFMVFPSVYEGFGLPPLEAMAAGVRVLVSDAASIPEVCGSAAIYFQSGNQRELEKKLVLMSSMEESERAKMIMDGKERARKFSWQKTAEKMERIVDGVFAS